MAVRPYFATDGVVTLLGPMTLTIHSHASIEPILLKEISGKKGGKCELVSEQKMCDGSYYYLHSRDAYFRRVTPY
jgi:hypothetical protein